MLRHAGYAVRDVDGKDGPLWQYASGEKVLDASGGPLLQTLVGLEPPDRAVFTTIGAAGGIETPLRRAVEADVLRRAGQNCGGVLWTSSGSDAMEQAIWAIGQVAPQSSRPRTYAVRQGSYHGNTLLTRWLSTRRESPGGGPVGCVRVVIPDPVDDWATTAIESLAASDAAEGTLLVLESVPTSGMPFWPGAPAYARVIDWCRQRGVRVLIDEVAAGTYRHGWFSAFDWAGAHAPDAVVLGKGLTCGRHPVACVLLSRDVAAHLLSSNDRLPAFTHGLSDAAAWWISRCLKTYDSLVDSGRLAERAVAIERCAAAVDSSAQGKVHVERTQTTLRLTLTDVDVSRAMDRELERRRIQVYRTACEAGDSYRAFALICPALDLDPSLATAALNGVADAVAVST